MWKKCKVVMLSTNEKGSQSTLALHSNKKLLLKCSPTAEFAEGSNGCKQHLYIISDEEIKEGDWCIMLDSFGNVFSNPQQYTNPETQFLNKGLRKIIATTDKSLFKEVSATGYTEDRARTFYGKEYLPKPSQEFLKIFVEEYNKGNVITEVMVEYEEAEEYDRVYGHENKFPRLKINSDNTINIKPIISTSEEIGEKIVQYCKKYEGTNKYNDVLKAIEFGYQLSIDKNL
jgi:hypothetical protein